MDCSNEQQDCLSAKMKKVDIGGHMTINVQVQRFGGMPAQWSNWGSGKVNPGQSINIGSGMGPFFTILGVEGGARFQHGTMLDIVLKVSGVAQQAFELPSQPMPPPGTPIVRGQYIPVKYMALVSPG